MVELSAGRLGFAFLLVSGTGNTGELLSPGIGNGFGCGGSALSPNGEWRLSSVFEVLEFAAGSCAERTLSAESPSRLTTTLRPTDSVSRPLVRRGASFDSHAVSWIWESEFELPATPGFLNFRA